jgi:hypothetical protein
MSFCQRRQEHVFLSLHELSGTANRLDNRDRQKALDMKYDCSIGFRRPMKPNVQSILCRECTCTLRAFVSFGIGRLGTAI